MSLTLPIHYISHYDAFRLAIHTRLREFEAVSRHDWFYELCYCLLTPQSKARNAEIVVQQLRAMKFQETQFDPTPHLRNSDNYIRFHNQKAKRLLTTRGNYPAIESVLLSDMQGHDKRNQLLSIIGGFGLKESSHFLRNIGYKNLAILDRHTLFHLQELSVIPLIPKSITPKLYLDIENKWLQFADKVGIPLDEMDLLFWSMQTGEILK